MEIIFVSSDRVEKTFKDYFSTMGFKGVQYDDDRNGIKQYHGVNVIPVLLLFSKSGVKLSDDLSTEVMQALHDDEVDELVQKYIQKAASLKPDPSEINDQEMPQIVPLQKTTSGLLNDQQEAALKLYKSGSSFELIQKCLGKSVDLSQLLSSCQNLNTDLKDTSNDDATKNTCEHCQITQEEEEKQPEGAYLNFDLLMGQIN